MVDKGDRHKNMNIAKSKSGKRAESEREMLLRKYTGCHLIYFSIIKDIKPAARGPTLFFPFSSSSFHFSLRAPARPRLLSFFFPAAGDGDKSEKKIQTASMVGRWDAIFRLPGDKNLINDRVVLKFKKGAASSLELRRKTSTENNSGHCSYVDAVEMS